MGKKSSARINSRAIKNSIKEEPRVLSCQKRNDVNSAVKKLLKITSQLETNAKLDWENHVEITKLLNNIMSIEPVESHTNRDSHFGNLIDWIKEHQGFTENIEISKFECMDYGLKATKLLNEGDLVCSIPQTVMMSLDNVKDSPLKHLYSTDPILSNMGNIALALFLILEYVKKTNSFWYPYIAALPEEYNTVLYFSLEDLKELKHSPAFEPTLKHCKNIARQYAYFYQVFQKTDDEASRLLRHNFTYRLYRWAVSTVMTRQNHVPSKDGKGSVNALIPLWDMCNHSNGYLTTQFKNETNRSECLAFRTFREGEQILIFYGKRSNSDFLLHNGFVYPENEQDTYRMKLGISKADPLHEGRTKLLNNLGIASSGEFYLRRGSEPLDGGLLAFLRIFNMDEGNLKHWLDSDRAEDLKCIDCALDTEIECKVWNFLFNRIKLLLSGYPQIPKVNDELVSLSRRSIRTLCELEKSLLRAVLDYVEQRLKV